ncbi:ABC transporter substrate-binding protein [Paenibacillus pasadenensis]|uniref:ABC transporter substrate-binding protein n=1 Tax=Paenibacillus pasadenensis TaxID=217090 RepID=UPI0020418477|nr:ABC transporter substrate-binding protein [Paenibacillus pasadenensis]MCM3747014.1 ABC transporter substrate-binding protein [Paenibacillus pasadenensis]
MLVAISLGAMALAGCSGNSEPEGGKAGKTTVTLWHPMTELTGEAMEEVVKAFEVKHPEIKVNPVYIAQQGEGKNEKLLAAVAGGNPPDVAYFDRFEVATWAAQGSLTDLTEFAKKDGIGEGQFYPFAWEESNYDGKLYAMPTTTDARLVFYNKDHFKEVGLDPEKPPTTIKELEHAADLLMKKDGRRFQRIGFIPWYGQGWFYGWGWSFGGEFTDAEGKVTANDPKNVEALAWMADYAKKYNIEDIASFTDSQGTTTMDPFFTGQLSIQVSGPWTVSQAKKFNPDLNYGVFAIPTPSGDNHTTWSGGWATVMPKGSKNQEAAWEFMKFFSGEEGQEIFSRISGDFSINDKVNEKLGYKEDPVFKEFIGLLPVSHARPVMPQGSLYWNELATAVDNATRGNGTPKDLLDTVTANVTKALGK